jgi:hypothetical protein
VDDNSSEHDNLHGMHPEAMHTNLQDIALLQELVHEPVQHSIINFQ